MTTSDFDQQFSAWLDGQLTGDELAAFEKELAARGFDPAAERRAAGRLGKMLRAHSSAPALANAEFFNRQLQHRIALAEPAPASRRGWFAWPRMVWAGAWCLLAAGMMFQAFIPHGAAPDRSDYFAQVIDARPLDAGISADTVYTARDNVTVVWLDGLDYLPADYQLQ